MKKKISYKKTRVFLHKQISDFERQYRMQSLDLSSLLSNFMDFGIDFMKFYENFHEIIFHENF